jgi:hypothetical protein
MSHRWAGRIGSVRYSTAQHPSSAGLAPAVIDSAPRVR